MKLTFFLALCVVAAAPLAGCGRPKTVPVSGRITANGKPVANLHVSFEPRSHDPKTGVAGPGSVGTTDGEGRFTLSTIQPVLQGAVPGEHCVTISMNSEDELAQDDRTAFDPTAKCLPRKAYDGSIRFTVPEQGTSSADFDLNRL